MFIFCLSYGAAEPNGEEDDQGDSGESETERDIRTFGRRTVHQGRAKVHLRGESIVFMDVLVLILWDLFLSAALLLCS